MKIKVKPRISRAIRNKAREVLRLAQEQAARVTYKDAFSNVLLAPGGLVSQVFPIEADRRAFCRTPEFDEMWEMIAAKPSPPPTGERVQIPPREPQSKKRTGAKSA